MASTKDIETRLFINGQFVPSSKGKTFQVHNPATEELTAEVHEADADDVNAAVAAAKAAQPAWAAKSAAERSAVLRKWAQLILQSGAKLGELDSRSMGVPAGRYAGVDAPIAANMVDHAAALSTSVGGHTSLNTPGNLNLEIRQPFGVVAGIVPWNYPLIMFVSKVAPAIAAGNAILLKCSEKSPLSGLLLAKLSVEAGIPPGILNVLNGAGITGQLLAEHMEIRKISFTGSTRTGRRILQSAAASNLKNVSLELGGKSPTIVFDDADLERAVPTLALSIGLNSGQTCTATSRVYVQEGIADKFTEAYKKALGAFATQNGPQADSIQAKTVASYLETGKTEGKALIGGEKAGDKGYFFQPTIFTDVSDQAKINKEEIFGPVVVLHKFKTEEDAISRANDTEYGLYASVWTQDIDRAIRVAKALEAGQVGVNSASPEGAADMPFGGWKQSGIGREGGSKGVDDWLEVKAVLIKHK